MKIKTLAVMGAAVLCAGVCLARPCGPGHHGGFHHPPVHHGWHGGPHHHYHGGWWGRGGCHFWPGFVGGVVGGAVCSAIARPYYTDTVVVQSTPTVVTQPVVVQQQPVVVQQPTVVTQPVVVQPQTVWVEGRYVDQVQANGSTVRIWQPGHYEQR